MDQEVFLCLTFFFPQMPLEKNSQVFWFALFLDKKTQSWSRCCFICGVFGGVRCSLTPTPSLRKAKRQSGAKMCPMLGGWIERFRNNFVWASWSTTLLPAKIFSFACFFQWSGCCWAVSCDVTRSLYCGHWQPSIGAAVSIFDNHAICDAFWRVRHVGVGPHPRVLIKRSAPQYMRVDKLSWSGFTRTDNRFTTSVLTRARDVV